MAAPSLSAAVSYPSPPSTAIRPGSEPLVHVPGVPITPTETEYRKSHSLPPSPGPISNPAPPGREGDLDTVRAGVETGLREYMDIQAHRFGFDEVAVRDRRVHAAQLASSLRLLRQDVTDIVRNAESHRQRRWLAGTAL